mmetsp:Transcript_38662/g.77412  ORF Transcript_38662/g.77412 Transcript_38662/m.77412 type:complete len:109 (-) Transcript_38662:183-509(-)
MSRLAGEKSRYLLYLTLDTPHAHAAVCLPRVREPLGRPESVSCLASPLFESRLFFLLFAAEGVRVPPPPAAGEPPAAMLRVDCGAPCLRTHSPTGSTSAFAAARTPPA